jgi:hypothetical protein
MHRRTAVLALAVAVTLAGGITGVMVWLGKPSYEDTLKACQKAITAQLYNDEKGKPAACKDVKDDDYTALVLSSAIDSLPQEDRDMLDYYDDGHMNGSIDN